jgi:hypothetical protein
MRTNLLAAALTALLTVGGSALAFAQAGDVIYAHRQEMAEANQPSTTSATQNRAFATATQHNDHDGNVASAARSSHRQPQG